MKKYFLTEKELTGLMEEARNYKDNEDFIGIELPEALPKNAFVVTKIKAKKIKQGDILWNTDDFELPMSIEQKNKYEAQETVISWEDSFGDVVPNDAIFLKLEKSC